MKKKILMIGDTSDLHGVSVDIRSYYDFFTSPVGGNWHHNEIETLRSPSRRLLYKKLDEIERADYDYVITIFSGHGKESINGTILVINGEADTIDAEDLANLSPRQLSIFDCCRSYAAMPADTQGTVLSMSSDPIRKAYEQKIQDSPPQGIYLFACCEGETAKDSDVGGRYSVYLLSAVRMMLAVSCSPFISVDEVHDKAEALMSQAETLTPQHPEMLCSRRSTRRCLPLAVNPHYL